MALSTSRLLTPNVSRSQSGVAAAMQAFITERAPNILMVPHWGMLDPERCYVDMGMFYKLWM